MSRPLAEVVAEGRRLQREIDDSDLLSGQRAEAWRTHDRFARANVDRLLAVAEAAMALRNAMATDWPLSLRDEIAALDALLDGDASAPEPRT